MYKSINKLDLYYGMIYTYFTMKNKQQKLGKTKTDLLLIRLTAQEKEGFQMASDIAGISLSSWARERLRVTAVHELEKAGRKIPFIPEITIGEQK